MNTLGPSDEPLLNNEIHFINPNPGIAPDLGIRIHEQDPNTREALFMKARIGFIENVITTRSLGNMLFWFLIFFGMFSGTTASSFLTIIGHRILKIETLFFPFLLVVAYYQVPYFFIGIYTLMEKDSSVTSTFRFLSVCNIVALSIVEIILILDKISANSMNMGMYNHVFAQLALPCLIGLPCQVIIVSFLVYKSTKFLLLLKEKEALERRLAEVRPITSPVVVQ